MADKSLIHWPVGMGGFQNLTTWTETTNALMTLNAAGEQFAMLVWFDGTPIDSIELLLWAGTNATTIGLEIQGIAGGDTVNVSGLPDGTPITNGTASVSSKGGSEESVVWSFGTDPSPVGPHFVVIRPSGGAFNIIIPYMADWGGVIVNRFYSNLGVQFFYDTDWGNSVSVGAASLRVKRTDGTYLESAMLGYSPFNNHEHTVGSYTTSSTTTRGVKFVAPYDMEMAGFRMAPTTVATYTPFEAVLIDSSNTVLSRSVAIAWHWPKNYACNAMLEEPVTLVAGETYRLYLKNAEENADSAGFLAASITAGDEAIVGVTAGDFAYTYATDPVSEGGVGAWTDDDTILPFFVILGMQDLNLLAAGGGGGGGETVSVSIT
jgi:hypothetical protein